MTQPFFALLVLFLFTAPMISTSGAAAKIPRAEPQTKSFNLETDPILYIGSVYGLDFNIGVGNRITVGPMITYVNGAHVQSEYGFVSGTSTGFGFGAKAKIFLSGERFSSSWILMPNIEFTSSKISALNAPTAWLPNPQTARLEETNYVARLSAGYEWHFKFGLSLAALGGVAVSYSNRSMVTDSSGSSTTLPSVWELTPTIQTFLGYTF
jgi:hypothetical protein